MAQLVASSPDREDDDLYLVGVRVFYLPGANPGDHAVFRSRPSLLTQPDAAWGFASIWSCRRSVSPGRFRARHRHSRSQLAGAQVWLRIQYGAKAIVIDDELALAGSANLDGRSLFLNYG